MHKLAIVIPYYKIDFFEETLKSVANQSNQNFTLYIGNDASPDDPSPLIEKYAAHLSYFYYQFEENLGGKNLALQWERVLEFVKEDWFQILGDDDLISENFVEAFYQSVNEIDRYGSNVIKYTQCWIDENNKVVRKNTAYPKLMMPWETWSKKYLNGDQSSLSEHIFRTSAYRNFRFVQLPLAWGSDDLAVLEFADGKPVFFIDAAEVRVRISTANISGKTDNDNVKKDAVMELNIYLITKYYKKLPKSYLLHIIDQQIKAAYTSENKSIKINLFKIYFITGEFKRFLKLPMLYYRLYKLK